MSSPLGWARANVIYEKMSGLPRPGTLAEAMMLMVWKARQSMMIAKTRAQAQAAIGGDKAVDAFSEFRDLVNRVEIRDRNDKMREKLEKLKEIKEIRFRPIVGPKKATKLRTVRLQEADELVPQEHKLRPITDFRPKRQR